MRIIEVVQGSPEWHSARCGIPTASNFDKVVTAKGEPSKQRQKYLYQLAGEMITGKAEETYQNGAMQRGIELEAEARTMYELLHNTQVMQTGLWVTEGSAIYGASPDGVVTGEEGLIEIKCPMLSTHVGYLVDGVLPAEYYIQVQGQLLVSERKWVDFVSYYPGMNPLIVRVEQDRKFTALLKAELEKFCGELSDIVRRLNA